MKASPLRWITELYSLEGLCEQANFKLGVKNGYC